jgi:hypothetical protein
MLINRLRINNLYNFSRQSKTEVHQKIVQVHVFCDLLKMFLLIGTPSKHVFVLVCIIGREKWAWNLKFTNF